MQVNTFYYCELCNVVVTTIAKVGIHIAKATHIQKKGVVIAKRIGNSAVAINGICVTAKAWNGFFEDSCAVCDSEGFDENVHEVEADHVLNLIRKKVHYIDEQAVYRVVRFIFHSYICC